MTKYEVGKTFPGPVPASEGAIMELWPDSLVVLIQMPGCTAKEVQAFKQSFQRYSYLETNTPVPIAVWVFDFPLPHGPIDMNFNAKPVKAEYLNNYLDTKEGIKNLVIFHLLDREVLRGIKAVGLQPEAVKLFHDTIRKQLGMEYRQSDYNRYLNAIFQYSTRELFRMGKIFNK